ncbi:hypothetical protein B0H14DRAFT_2592120 [Mycena olivaceomarginata]|nr:hypothetical protein B0H14DRAFT_2592120 [Mycena olivaceomarginata]
MTPKLCSAETMLWCYLKLKPSGTKTSIPSITFLSHSDSAFSFIAQEHIQHHQVVQSSCSTMNINLGLPLSSSVFPPRPVLVFFQLGVKPNYFRRSQVELDLAPSLILDTTKVPVHPATTSPNPDSMSARPIQVHFNNFHLELNYSGLKLDVPGTRLITSQVMLNYHSSNFFLAFLDSFSCFTEPQARIYHFSIPGVLAIKAWFILEYYFSNIPSFSPHLYFGNNFHPAQRPIPWHDNPKVVSPDGNICSFRDTVDFKFTSGVESGTSSMSTIVEEFLYFLPPISCSKGTRKRVNSYSTTSRQPFTYQNAGESFSHKDLNHPMAVSIRLDHSSCSPDPGKWRHSPNRCGVGEEWDSFVNAIAAASQPVFGDITTSRRPRNQSILVSEVPILANPNIVERYSETLVHTLEKNSLLSARVTRRPWIDISIHDLAELLLVRDLCGTFYFSIQFIIGMESAGTVVLLASTARQYISVTAHDARDVAAGAVGCKPVHRSPNYTRPSGRRPTAHGCTYKNAVQERRRFVLPDGVDIERPERQARDGDRGDGLVFPSLALQAQAAGGSIPLPVSPCSSFSAA